MKLAPHCPYALISHLTRLRMWSGGGRMLDWYSESPARPTVPTGVLIIINFPCPHAHMDSVTSGKIFTPLPPFPHVGPLSRARRFWQSGKQLWRNRKSGRCQHCAVINFLWLAAMRLSEPRPPAVLQLPPPSSESLSPVITPSQSGSDSSGLSCSERWYSRHPLLGWIFLDRRSGASQPAPSERHRPGAQPDPCCLSAETSRWVDNVSNPQITQHKRVIAEFKGFHYHGQVKSKITAKIHCNL